MISLSKPAPIPAHRRFRPLLLLLALLATSALLASCRRTQPPAEGGTAVPGAAETEAARPNAEAGTEAGASAGADPTSREPEDDNAAYWAALEDEKTLLALLHAPAPPRDPVDIALRLGRIDAPPPPPPSEPVKAYAVGDVERFWLHDITRQRYFEVEAKLETIRPGGYFWVQVDQTFNAEALERGATSFDEDVLPAVRALYGREWSPGIDGDPRIHVLHHEPVPGIAGYFYSVDEYPSSVEPNSNEREMFYVNLSVYTPGSFDYLSLLAHELQHMIHWASDRNETVWANEGLAELSSQVAGYRTQKGNAFTESPDTALMEWSEDPAGNAQHYAASYAFFAYLLERFGEPVIRAFVEAQADGVAGVEEAMDAIGQPVPFDTLFLDWVVANVLPQDLSGGDPRYGYGSTEIRRAVPELLRAEGAPPLEADVQPYGTDYYDLTDRVREGRLELAFQGDAEVGLLEAGGGMAERIAWSGRGDNLDSRMTWSGLTLPADTPARLTFESRYEIEDHWDYAYVTVSTDGGESWAPLATSESTSVDPNANNLGEGITGRSQGWKPVEVDLADYAGQTVDLRWELISDDAVSLSGMAIRSISLGSAPDAAGAPFGRDLAVDQMTVDEGFRFDGWRRVPALLPQRWGLQLILGGEGDPVVTRIPVDAEGRASVSREGIPDGASVTLAVSAMTPATRQAARYTLRDLGEGPTSGDADASGAAENGSGSDSSTGDAGESASP